jgi:hypothetical protein
MRHLFAVDLGHFRCTLNPASINLEHIGNLDKLNDTASHKFQQD